MTLRLTVVILFFFGAESNARADAPVEEVTASFDREVMAVFSRSGCNQGGCHGNQNGKGGFRLSLRGQDPQFDYRSVVEQYSGRRIDRFQSEQSLLLLKPTSSVSHRGGKRFGVGDREYEILKRWIESGAQRDSLAGPLLSDLVVEPARIAVVPGETMQLRTTGVLSDGTEQDVSGLSVFESTDSAAAVDSDGLVTANSIGESTIIVRYLDRQVPVEVAVVGSLDSSQFLDPVEWDTHPVDRRIAAKLRLLRLNPSELCADTPFVRRAFLDLVGRLPTADEARQFMADRQGAKRERLIDQLLADPRFATVWALKWSDLLRNEEKTLDERGVRVFHQWIESALNDSMPIDRFVRELIASRGSTYENPAANYYRALRDPLTRGESTARLFLGVRLQCAKCHNHPFERWTQDEYYSWASLFAPIDYEIVENERRDKYDKHEFNGEQVVKILSTGEVTNARTGQPAAPRFLGVAKDVIDDDVDRLEQLADWMTSPANRRFAEVQVNWVWYHLFGVGIIDPVDDFRITNRAANQSLLDDLTDRFIASGYDLKALVRLIATSRAYQLSSAPTRSNRHDTRNFARVYVRRLSAELLLDAQNQVLQTRSEFAVYPDAANALGLPGSQVKRPQEGDLFLRKFGKPTRQLGCECERSNETTLSHAFYLIGGESLNGRLTDVGNRLSRMIERQMSDDAMIEELFWTSLSRSPTGPEKIAATELLAASESPLDGLQDIAWSLLNSKEFVFRH